LQRGKHGEVQRREAVIGEGAGLRRVGGQNRLQPFDAAERRCLEYRQLVGARQERVGALDLSRVQRL
jgi:hypothetical protein